MWACLVQAHTPPVLQSMRTTHKVVATVSSVGCPYCNGMPLRVSKISEAYAEDVDMKIDSKGVITITGRSFPNFHARGFFAWEHISYCPICGAKLSEVKRAQELEERQHGQGG